jgi:hypothetical protein
MPCPQQQPNADMEVPLLLSCFSLQHIQHSAKINQSPREQGERLSVSPPACVNLCTYVHMCISGVAIVRIWYRACLQILRSWVGGVRPPVRIIRRRTGTYLPTAIVVCTPSCRAARTLSRFA